MVTDRGLVDCPLMTASQNTHKHSHISTVHPESKSIELFIFPQQDLSKTERVTHCGKGTHRSYNVKLQLGQSVG